MRIKRIVWMTLLVVMALVAAASADPFVGVWKMQANDKSGFKAQVVTISATADGHKWSYDITLSTGKPFQLVLLTNLKTGEITMQSKDGKTVASGHFKKTGDAAWEVEAPNHKSTGSISADGKKMTVNQTEPLKVTLVFDKQ